MAHTHTHTHSDRMNEIIDSVIAGSSDERVSLDLFISPFLSLYVCSMTRWIESLSKVLEVVCARVAIAFIFRYISVSFYFPLFYPSRSVIRLIYELLRAVNRVLISARHSTILNCRPQIPRETAFDRPQSRVPVEIGVRMAPSVISITTRSSVGRVGYRRDRLTIDVLIRERVSSVVISPRINPTIFLDILPRV